MGVPLRSRAPHRGEDMSYIRRLTKVVLTAVADAGIIASDIIDEAASIAKDIGEKVVEEKDK